MIIRFINASIPGSQTDEIGVANIAITPNQQNLILQALAIAVQALNYRSLCTLHGKLHQKWRLNRPINWKNKIRILFWQMTGFLIPKVKLVYFSEQKPYLCYEPVQARLSDGGAWHTVKEP